MYNAFGLNITILMNTWQDKFTGCVKDDTDHRIDSNLIQPSLTSSLTSPQRKEEEFNAFLSMLAPVSVHNDTGNALKKYSTRNNMMVETFHSIKKILIQREERRSW